MIVLKWILQLNHILSYVIGVKYFWSRNKIWENYYYFNSIICRQITSKSKSSWFILHNSLIRIKSCYYQSSISIQNSLINTKVENISFIDKNICYITGGCDVMVVVGNYAAGVQSSVILGSQTHIHHTYSDTSYLCGSYICQSKLHHT